MRPPFGAALGRIWWVTATSPITSRTHSADASRRLDGKDALMRFPHWIKTVASALLLTASVGPVLAQDGGQLPMFQPAYGTNDPGVLYPQGVPSGYQPYPAISPYQMGNIGWDQTYQDGNGLWMRRMLWQDREWFSSLDVLHSTIKNPGDKHLGSAYVPIDEVSQGLLGDFINTYNEGGTPGTGQGGNQGGGGGSTLPTSRIYVNSRVYPYPFLVPSNAPGNAIVDNARFPLRDLTEFDDFRSAGMKASLGFFNEDGSGWSLNGVWSGQDKQVFHRGFDSINGVEITQEIILSQQGRMLFSRNGAIPLNWGFQTGGTSFDTLGTNKYDLLFHYDVKTSALGADTNFYFPPTIQRQAFKLRPFLGARYLHIDEQFYFRGIDSGFGYTIDGNTVGGGGGGGGGGNNTTSRTYRPDPASLQINYDLFEATLSNNVKTNLAGPQFGFRYDFGEGDEFNVWGQSTVGLLANREDYSQFGNNIGDQQGLLLFSSGIDMLATDARFRSRRSVNHVSPMFEQTFMVEAEILDMIPLVRNLPMLEDTVFRCGYTVTVVGGVARAGESIDWKGFPFFPGIKPGRETWFMQNWNFGLEKRF